MGKWLWMMDTYLLNYNKVLFLLKGEKKKIPVEAVGGMAQLKKIADEIRLAMFETGMYIKILKIGGGDRASRNCVVEALKDVIGKNKQKCDDALEHKADDYYNALLRARNVAKPKGPLKVRSADQLKVPENHKGLQKAKSAEILKESEKGKNNKK